MGDEARLDARTRALVELSAVLARREMGDCRVALQAAARHADDAEIEETLLQAHLFVGFPAVLNAFIAWREIERSGAGAGSEAGEANAPGERTVAEDGEALCRAVYGEVYDRLRDHVRRLHPDLDTWMVEHGYGRTLSRDGLSAETRELCIVGLLAAAGHERQLRAHLHGALNVGAPAWRVEAALRLGIRVSARPQAGPEAPAGADPTRLYEIWEDVAGRSRNDGGRNGGWNVERASCSST